MVFSERIDTILNLPELLYVSQPFVFFFFLFSFIFFLLVSPSCSTKSGTLVCAIDHSIDHRP